MGFELKLAHIPWPKIQLKPQLRFTISQMSFIDKYQKIIGIIYITYITNR